LDKIVLPILGGEWNSFGRNDLYTYKAFKKKTHRDDLEDEEWRSACRTSACFLGRIVLD
jgi:hypothetical protein